MLGEWRESQSTPVQEKKDKGKGKEREVNFSDIEELDGPPSSKGSEPKPSVTNTYFARQNTSSNK